jgi:CheY-like chemotaxis protein
MTKKTKILFLDDDQAVLQIVNLYFKQTKVVLSLAETGAECIDLLSKDPDYDLIFLDFMLPDTNGLILINQIRQQNILHKIPIVLQTGIMDVDFDAIQQENVKILYKPYSKNDLFKIFDEFCIEI